MPCLQDGPVDPHPTPHCCSLRLFAGAHDRRHLMTAMNSPSTKSLSNSLVPVRATGNPCLELGLRISEALASAANPGTSPSRVGGRCFSTIEVSRQNALSEALIKRAAIQSP